MGSSGSKHKDVKKRSSSQPNSPDFRKSSNGEKKPKKSRKRKNLDSQSLTSGGESRRSSISYTPNGTLTKHGSEPKLNGNAVRIEPLPNGNVRHGSKLDVAQVTPLVPLDNEKPQNGTLTKKNAKNEVVKEQNNNTMVHVSNVPEDSTDVDSVNKTHPDSGADYNGGGALPKSTSTQNIFSRLKNGMGTNKKSSLQLIWEATRDESKKKLSHLCDVAFLSSDHIAISRGENGKPGLQLYQLQDGGRPGQVLGESFLKSPRGVCVGNDGSIAVTDWEDKTVQFMDMNGNYLGAWKTNKFQHPGGIVINRDGRYVVADLTRKEAAIGLYSPYGKLFRRFGADNFDWPWYVAVDRRNRILVSERKNSMINVFDEDGRFLFKFGGSEMTGGSGRSARGDDMFNAPGGLAVDAQNNILVVDSDNYRISMFSPDGIFIKTLITTTFSRPVSVAYDDGMVAMVTDSDLRLYKTYLEKTSL